jgi:hypothetical protein
LIEAETEALAEARKIIAPHTEIASFFGERAEVLNWQMPKKKEILRAKNDKFTIVFPASTVGRKGVYELRTAIKNLNVKLIILGGNVESDDFWQGFDVEKGTENWLEIADLVAFPAFVEHKPRRILLASANEIPCIASTACGVANVANVEVIKIGDAVKLREAIEAKMQKVDKTKRSYAQISA